MVDRASIQEYVLHSWSLVKIGATAAQKNFFSILEDLEINLRSMRKDILLMIK